jgi:hypothetical protein
VKLPTRKTRAPDVTETVRSTLVTATRFNVRAVFPATRGNSDLLPTGDT